MMEEPPYTITEYLSLEEMKELYHDCQLYHSLETNEENKSFWQSMLLICDAEMTKRRESSNHPSSSSKSSSKATGAAAAAGVGKDILDDITRLLEGKTLSQLEKLYTEVESKLSGGGPVDVGKNINGVEGS